MLPTCQTASSIRHRKPAVRLNSTSAWPSSRRASERNLIAIVHQPARAGADVVRDRTELHGQVAAGRRVVEPAGGDLVDGAAADACLVLAQAVFRLVADLVVESDRGGAVAVAPMRGDRHL